MVDGFKMEAQGRTAEDEGVKANAVQLEKNARVFFEDDLKSLCEFASALYLLVDEFIPSDRLINLIIEKNAESVNAPKKTI